VVGGMLGAGVFLALHLRVVAQLFTLAGQANGATSGERGHFLVQYFFRTKYYRHVPEFVAFSIGAFVFFRKRLYRSNLFVTFSLMGMLLASLILSRPNHHYMVFLYPVFLLILVSVSRELGQLPAVSALFLAFLLPQYAMVYWKNRGFDYPKAVSDLRALVPVDTSPIVGNGDAWYLFPGRDFYYYGNRDLPGKTLASGYLLRNTLAEGEAPGTVENFLARHRVRAIGAVPYGSTKYEVFAVE
jgi:hypothetical protein